MMNSHFMGPNILIVDNIPTQMRVLENILKQIGYKKVFTCRNAKEAMAIIVEHPDIGLVITEWDLPDKSGLDLLELIKLNDALSKIPVILAFKVKSKDDIAKALQSGVACFIVKPYRPEVVKKKISKLLIADGALEKSPNQEPNMDDINGPKQGE